MSKLAEACHDLDALLTGDCAPKVEGPLGEELTSARHALRAGHKEGATTILRNIASRHLLDVNVFVVGRVERILDLINPKNAPVSTMDCVAPTPLGNCMSALPTSDGQVSLES